MSCAPCCIALPPHICCRHSLLGFRNPVASTKWIQSCISGRQQTRLPCGANELLAGCDDITCQPMAIEAHSSHLHLLQQYVRLASSWSTVARLCKESIVLHFFGYGADTGASRSTGASVAPGHPESIRSRLLPLRSARKQPNSLSSRQIGILPSQLAEANGAPSHILRSLREGRPEGRATGCRRTACPIYVVRA